MGKGNRNDRQKIENQSASEERFLQKQKAQKSKKRSDKVIAAACVVIALIVVAILVLNVFNETGVFLRMQNVASLEDVTVDKAMMTFFVNDYISNWNAEYINYVNQYYYYFLIGSMKTISLDLSKDLDDQKITQDDVDYYLGDSSYVGLTWFEYFRDQVISTVEMYVTYANGANAQGITLDDEDKKDIDEIIEKLKSDLKKQGLTISDVYGKGVSESDVRKCYELIYLASAFGEENKGKIESTIKEENVNTFRDEHKEDYYFAKYFSHTISLSEKKFKTQQEYDSAVEAAKEAIEKIASAKNPTQFLEYIEEYKKNPVDTGSTETTTESKKEETTKPAETTTKDESKEETETTDPLEEYQTIYYETNDELGKWLFDESDPAWDNEVKVIEVTGTETVKETETKKPTSTESESDKSSKAGETESETGKKNDNTVTKTYKTFKITVYMVRDHRGLDVESTHNFAYLITDQKAAIDSFLKEFNALKDEEKTKDKFYNIADAYFEKNYADHEHSEDEEHVDPIYEYNKVTRKKNKFFATNYGQSFSKLDKFVDAKERADGDYTVHGDGNDTAEYIEITSGTGDNKVTYYAVVFFDKHDVRGWYADCFANLTQHLIDEWYKAEIEENPVKVDKNAFTDITVVKYESSSEQ